MKNMKEIGGSFMFFRKGGEGIRKNQECGKYWLWNHFTEVSPPPHISYLSNQWVLRPYLMMKMRTGCSPSFA